MNKRIKIDKKIILLKNFIQISVSLCLKAKRVPLAHRGAVWLSTWRNSRCQSNCICARFINISPKLTRTERKSQPQIDINVNSLRFFAGLMRQHVGWLAKFSLWSFRIMKACSTKPFKQNLRIWLVKRSKNSSRHNNRFGNEIVL